MRIGLALFHLIMIVVLIANAMGQQTASDLIVQGKEMLNQSNCEKALQYFDKAIGMEPNNADARGLKGVSLYGLGKYDEAMQVFNETLLIDTRNAYALVGKGYVLKAQNKTEEAIQVFDDVIRIDPQEDAAWNGKAEILLGQGKYNESIQAYDEVLKIDPQDANASISKGLALILHGATTFDEKTSKPHEETTDMSERPFEELERDFKEAFKCFVNASKIMPNSTEPWVLRGAASALLETVDDDNKSAHTTEAIKSFEKAIEINPRDSNIWFAKGNVLFYNELFKEEDLNDKGIDYKGNYTEAIKCLDRALELDPRNEWARSIKGWALNVQGKHDEVKKLLLEGMKYGHPVSKLWYEGRTISEGMGIEPPDESWNKTYGRYSENEIGNSVQQTSDGGYVIAGVSFDFSQADALLIKTDSSGNELWVRNFGGSGNDSASFVQQTNDGGYIIAGTTDSYRAEFSILPSIGLLDFIPGARHGKDIWLIKTDSDGNELWNKTFGGFDDDRGLTVKQTRDGGYIVLGNTIFNKEDIVLIKTTSSGDDEWIKVFGGSNQEFGGSIQHTKDGGYIITGYTFSYGSGENDLWLVKTHSNGTEEWNKTYGGEDDDRGESIQQTKDGGYIITGSSASWQVEKSIGRSNVWLIKTNSKGEEEWDKLYYKRIANRGSSVQQTNDSGYVIVGYTSGKFTLENLNGGWEDVWLIKTNSEGIMEWDKIFGRADGIDEGHSVQQTTDGGYIIAGETDSYSIGQMEDVWLIKVDGKEEKEDLDHYCDKYCGKLDYSKLRKAEEERNGAYLVYYLNSESQMHGDHLVYYDKDKKKLKVQGCWLNNKRSGRWKIYFENGKTESETDYENNSQNGRSVEFFETGNIKSEGNYKSGRKNGQWINYWENGNRKWEANYKDGKLDGRAISYYETEVKELEADYKDDKTDGHYVHYYESGNREYEGDYREKIKMGHWIFYAENGIILEEGDYVEGVYIKKGKR